MYNYSIKRFSCADVFRWCFCAGVCLGGAIGILLGLMDKSIGFYGGTVFGLLFGLFSGFFALVYAAIFNILSPHFGGLAVSIESIEAAGDEAPTASDQEPAAGPDDNISSAKEE
jgi:hypothetical protein